MRILVADDHDIIRRGLKALLTSRAGWEVCAEAKTGREAVALAEQFKPDVVVMDISMPDLNGLEAARKIRKSVPKSEILILTLAFFRSTRPRNCRGWRARVHHEVRR